MKRSAHSHTQTSRNKSLLRAPDRSRRQGRRSAKGADSARLLVLWVGHKSFKHRSTGRQVWEREISAVLQTLATISHLSTPPQRTHTQLSPPFTSDGNRIWLKPPEVRQMPMKWKKQPHNTNKTALRSNIIMLTLEFHEINHGRSCK